MWTESEAAGLRRYRAHKRIQAIAKTGRSIRTAERMFPGDPLGGIIAELQPEAKGLLRDVEAPVPDA